MWLIIKYIKHISINIVSSHSVVFSDLSFSIVAYSMFDLIFVSWEIERTQILESYDGSVITSISWKGRSSPPEVFLRKGVLKICSKFTGEHPYRCVISIKLQSNFKKKNSANEISNDVIEVALLCKSDNNNVLVSGIIPHSDKRNAKAIEVNRHLKTNVVREIFALLVIQILTQSTTVTKVVFTLIGK